MLLKERDSNKREFSVHHRSQNIVAPQVNDVGVIWSRQEQPRRPQFENQIKRWQRWVPLSCSLTRDRRTRLRYRSMQLIRTSLYTLQHSPFTKQVREKDCVASRPPLPRITSEGQNMSNDFSYQVLNHDQRDKSSRECCSAPWNWQERDNFARLTDLLFIDKRNQKVVSVFPKHVQDDNGDRDTAAPIDKTQKTYQVVERKKKCFTSYSLLLRKKTSKMCHGKSKDKTSFTGDHLSDRRVEKRGPCSLRGDSHQSKCPWERRKQLVHFWLLSHRVTFRRNHRHVGPWSPWPCHLRWPCHLMVCSHETSGSSRNGKYLRVVHT